MTGKLDEQLLIAIEDAENSEPTREFPVIVILHSGADQAALGEIGMKIIHSIDAISAVSGTLTATQVREVEILSEVESIEYDGSMHAL